MSIRLGLKLSIALGTLWATAVIATAADQTSLGDIWIISTRQAARCGSARASDQPVRCWQCVEGRWVANTLPELTEQIARDPRPLYVFIHGNRATLESAVADGEAVRQALDRLGRRYRLLIWAWPSDRVGRRPRPDAQIKHAYTPKQARYLAELLPQWCGSDEIVLLGYSFGARIATEALDRWATARRQESPEGDRIDFAPYKWPRIKLILIAAAIDSGDLSLSGRYGRGVASADEIIVTKNRFDPALRFYPKLFGRAGPQALGFIGPCGSRPEAIRLIDLSCAVGKTHSWTCYATTLIPHILGAGSSENKTCR